MYNQALNVCNDSFDDAAFNEWMAAEKAAALGRLKDKRPDVLSFIKEVFVGDKTEVEQYWYEDCKDADMSDVADGVAWNDVWRAPQAHSTSFDGLFNDQEELLSFVDDDWNPSRKVTANDIDSEARAVLSWGVH